MSGAPSNPIQELSAALETVVADAARSVVSVHSRRSRSSGFAWRSNLIVTPDEALAEEGEITVELPGGETVEADLVGRDPTTDVALLRVPRPDLTPASLQATTVAPGAIVLMVGAEQGAPVAAMGGAARVAGPWRSMRGGEIDARLELSIVLRRPTEGSLVLDAAGRCLGMAVFGPRQRVLVIPSTTIERVAAALDKHGRIARGYLGVGLQQVRLQGGSGTGIMVMSVDPNGPGAAAGLYQGDIILAWDGEPVKGASSIARRLGPESVGRQVTLSVRRGGEAVEVGLTIGERPVA